MLELLPPYLRPYSEMKAIMHTEGSEIETINNTHNQLVDNRYITTCDETGIEHFEKLLNVTPLSNDTLDDRKMRCIARWNQVLPYNYTVLVNKLAALCGKDGFSLEMDFAAQSLVVKLALGVKNQFAIAKNVIDEMVPCNIITDISVMFNTHEVLSAYTHEQLATRTYEQMREEVL